ncbi:hypothetical protein PMAYCL1PPCAC_19314, partial [Pristionchus mayeri]
IVPLDNGFLHFIRDIKEMSLLIKRAPTPIRTKSFLNEIIESPLRSLTFIIFNTHEIYPNLYRPPAESLWPLLSKFANFHMFTMLVNVERLPELCMAFMNQVGVAADCNVKW